MTDAMTYTLSTGLKIGERSYTGLRLRCLGTGDAIDAAEAAERVQLSVAGEPVVISSPTRATAERIRRNIAALYDDDGNELQGPLSLTHLRCLSEADYLALVRKSEALDRAYLERVLPDGEGAPAGRSESAGPGGDPDGADTGEG